MKILFVCTGNTCRSPMAEGYFNSLSLPLITAESRGLSASGCPVSENSALVLGELGIDISAHLSRLITEEDKSADRIICMTEGHRAALSAAGFDKLSVLGNGIPDPYGGDIDTYRQCRDSIINEIRTLAFGGELNGISVAKTEVADLPAIAELERQCFSSPWSKRALLESLQAGTHFFTARINNKIAGYAGVSIVAGEGYITNIAVFGESRRKGVGSTLISYLVESARAARLEFLTLEVRPSNETAISLYKKYGFAQAGLRKGFYTSPKEDALIFTRRF